MAEAREPAAAGTRPAAGPRGTHTPAFRRLWWAWAVSICGDGLRTLALPVYVAVQTRDPLAASAVTAAEVVPWLLVALPAGAVVDRADPRRVVVLAHVTRAALTAGLVVALLTGTAGVPVLCAFAFLLTTAETFAYPATQVLLVELAGPAHLERANASFFAVHTVGLNLFGPLAAGAILLVEPALAFAIDGATFLVAAALIASLPSVSTAGDTPQRARRTRRDVAEGLRLLWVIPGLRVLVSMVAMGTIAATVINTLLAVYAVQVLHLGPVGVSFLVVSMALTTLAATQAAPVLARRWSDGAVMIAGMTLVGAGIFLVGLVPVVLAAWAGNVLLGFGIGLWNVLSAVRRQRLTPPAALGRVSGAYRVVAWGLMPAGAALAGPLAVATSLGTAFVVAGLFALGVTALLAVPLLRTGECGISSPAGPSA